jgi:hypothetical protein
MPSSFPMASMQAEDGEPFMAGLVFHWVIHNAPAAAIGEHAKSIEHYGGKVVSRYDASVTHVVLETTGGGAVGDADDIEAGPGLAAHPRAV